MRKLGLLGRWRVFPASGNITIDGDGTREIEIRFNTMEQTVIYVEELEHLVTARRGDGERGEDTGHHKVPVPAQKTLLGVVDGLETFNFRAHLPCRIVIDQAGDASSVFFDTEAGKNYTIDGEHLRDFTVPMLGRRERNEELDAIRFEMRQEMRAMGGMFQEFMAFKNAMTRNVQEEKPSEQSSKAEQHADTKPDTGKDGTAGDKTSGDVRSGVEKRPERSVPAHDEVQGTTTKGDPDGSPS